jgi:cytochrome c oxidase subunit II
MKVIERLGARLVLGLALMLATGTAAAAWGLNMTAGVSPISRQVYDLHMLILWVCVAIGALVFGVILWSVIHHRKSRGVVPAQFHHNTSIEIAWTVVPMLILILMAIPATRVLVQMADTSDAELTIKVTGYQWMWGYEYLDEDIQFFSRLDAQSDRVRQVRSGLNPREVENYLLEVDRPLVIPVNTKIRFLLTANDVIHSFWVPDLGWKRDAIPGFINEAWSLIETPGTYRGQCAELCGRDHAFMPIVVVAMEQDDYRQWVDEQRNGAAQQPAPSVGVPPPDAAPTERAAAEPAPEAAEEAADEVAEAPAQEPAEEVAEAPEGELGMDELMASGEKLYNQVCVACHQAKGQGMAPIFPAIAGSKMVAGPVEENIALILNGRGAMPPFGRQLSDEEVAAVVTYIRNAFGNETGDTVQPADVQAVR